MPDRNGPVDVDLTPYVPRLALQWDRECGPTRHAAVDGSMVFADVSGFTRLSERLALAGGRLGAEQLTEVINGLFDELLTVAVRHGGEMLKYGGDAVLLLFRGEGDAMRAVGASLAMQAKLREIGRVETSAGVVRLRMSVGVHTGTFDMFLVGSSHRELVVGGPDASRTIEIEGMANATEVLVSPQTASQLVGARFGTDRDGCRLVKRLEVAAETAPVLVPHDPRAAEFVSAGLRDHLQRGGVEAEHRLVTQAFLHLTGLDTVLAAAGAETAAEHLDETMSQIQEACVRYGVSFLSSDIAGNGTKAILVAGAPATMEQLEARMLSALVAIQEADCPLPVRVGVHSGHVFTGEVGPSFRRTYTTIGDVTNTAARVMGNASAGEIRTLAPVVEALARSHRFEEMPPFIAKGKAEPLVPFRWVGALTDDETSGLVSRTTPFTARDQELEAMLRAVESTTAGPPVVDVVGEAGMGKTRILTELVDALGLPVRRLGCEPYEASTPYFVVGHLLRAVAGPAATANRAALDALVEERCPSLSPWVPLLAGVLDLDATDTAETAMLDPRYRRQRTCQVVAELLAAVTDERTVLVFDDVQWADDSSSDVLAHLAAERVERPWILGIARRPSTTGHVPDEGVDVRVELAPLVDAAAEAFVEAAMADDPLPPHRVARLVEHGAGNPLFLEALLGLDLSGDVGDLPESLEAIVASEIDRLPGDARRLLRLAAVHGARFTYGQLVETARDEGIELPDDRGRSLLLLAKGAIVREPGGELAFRHHVLRDVAYASLPFRQRRQLHGHAADALRRAGGVDDDRLGLLSLHEFNAQRYDDCWRHSQLAGERAASKNAYAEAVVAYRRALDAAARCTSSIDTDELAYVWERLGDSSGITGDQAQASAAYKQARRRSTSPTVVGRLCAREARLAEVSGSRQRARRWMCRGLETVADETGEDAGCVRADLLAMSAWTAAQEGHPEAALDLAEEAIAAGSASGAREAVADALILMDDALLALGREHEAIHTDAALSLYDEVGSEAMKASALNNLGVRHHNRGDWARAREFYNAARAANLAAGNVVDAGFQTYNVAELLVDQGHFDRAEGMLDDLDNLWRSVRFDVGLVFARGLRGVLEFRRHRLDAAIELLDDARKTLHGANLHTYAVTYDLVAAEAHLLNGDLDAASAAVDQVERASRAAQVPGAEPGILRVRGEMAIRRGDLDQARSLMLSSVEVARASASLFHQLLGLLSLRKLDVSDGQHGHQTDEEIDRLVDRLDVNAEHLVDRR